MLTANSATTRVGDLGLYPRDAAWGQRDQAGRDGGGNVALWVMNGATIASVVNVGNIPANWAVQGANAD